MDNSFCIAWIDPASNGNAKPIPCKRIEKSEFDGFWKLVGVEQISEKARPQMIVTSLTVRETALVYIVDGFDPIEEPHIPVLVEDEDSEDLEPVDDDPEDEPPPPKKRKRKRKKAAG